MSRVPSNRIASMDNIADLGDDGGPRGVAGSRPRMITIELFGVPRLRAGIPLVQLEAVDLGQALRGLARVCPNLDGSVLIGDRIHPAYKLSLNADRFVTEPETPLKTGDVLLLLAADVGG